MIGNAAGLHIKNKQIKMKALKCRGLFFYLEIEKECSGNETDTKLDRFSLIYIYVKLRYFKII